MFGPNNMSKYLILGLLAMGLRPMPAAAAPFVYVANFNTNNVAVIDAASQTLVSTIPLPPLPDQCGPGDCGPGYVAITPDGGYAYVTISGLGNSVAVIDTTLALTDPANAVVAVIPVGMNPQEVAINPDGGHAYVTNAASHSISVIDTALAVSGTPTLAVVSTVLLKGFPHGVSVSPDGSTLWVTEPDLRKVDQIGTAAALFGGLIYYVQSDAHDNDFPDDFPIDVFAKADGTAIVTDFYSQLFICFISPICEPSKDAGFPSLDPQFASYGLALTSDFHLYIARGGTPYVQEFNVVPSLDCAPLPWCVTIGPAIGVGTEPFGIALSYDGTQVYVTNTNDSTVSVIDVKTNLVIGAPISVGAGGGPLGVAVTPTPAQAIARTITLVQGLGSLNAGEQTSLIDSLDAASNALDRGNVTAGCNQIGAFLNKENALVRSRRLTAQEAAASFYAATATRSSLKCR